MRPNILYIFTDQQQGDAMSCAGNDLVQTPTADRLAAEGVRFPRAYCAQPVCMPSRAAMQTGRWPHANGVIVNHGSLDMSLGLQSEARARPMLAQTFADAGYETAYFGRWHIKLPTERSERHGYQKVSQHDANDSAIAPSFSSFLDNRSDRPFFAVVSICNPHDICRWPKDSTMPNGPIPDVPVPDACPPLPDNFDIPANEASLVREFQKDRAPMYKAPYYEPHEWRQFRWAYWRFVESADRTMGEVIEALVNRGLRDSTVIVFSSDHGEGAASHRWCHKQALYEEETRVPFVIAPPSCSRAGQTDARLTNAGIDLYPTLCEYAGIRPPHWLHGRSVKPLVDGATVDDWPDFTVTETEFHAGGAPYGTRGRMLRTERYSYSAFSHGEPREHLFDLENDPHEMTNLAVDSKYREVLHEHRERLREWCRKYDDFFVGPWATNSRPHTNLKE